MKGETLMVCPDDTGCTVSTCGHREPHSKDKICDNLQAGCPKCITVKQKEDNKKKKVKKVKKLSDFMRK